MASVHDHRQDQKAWFMAGYNEMLHRIEPEKIICYNTPFPEMQGNIIPVDYERSSWKYMSYDRKLSADKLDVFKMGGAERSEYDTINPYMIGKGGGSAYGGKWRPNPNKPQDLAFKGPPNTIQRHFIPTRKGGFWLVAKYDSKGNAVKIRHETSHAPGSNHTDPHDHIYSWDTPDAHPVKTETINYPHGTPEFKTYTRELNHMDIHDLDELYRFHTISEFKWSMHCGAEVVIEWKNKEFGIWSERDVIRITSDDVAEQRYTSADDALEYIVCGDRLRDVITQVTVIERTI